MLIPGHIGFTFGAYYVITRIVKTTPITYKKLSAIALIALIPDVADKGLHLVFGTYPDHAVFHSLFLYSLLMVIAIILRRTALFPVIGILAFHSILDLVNNLPGVLVYPLMGFSGYNHYYLAIGNSIVKRIPQLFCATYITGHYLLFEILGSIMIVLMILAVKFKKV